MMCRGGSRNSLPPAPVDQAGKLIHVCDRGTCWSPRFRERDFKTCLGMTRIVHRLASVVPLHIVKVVVVADPQYGAGMPYVKVWSTDATFAPKRVDSTTYSTNTRRINWSQTRRESLNQGSRCARHRTIVLNDSARECSYACCTPSSARLLHRVLAGRLSRRACSWQDTAEATVATTCAHVHMFSNRR